MFWGDKWTRFQNRLPIITVATLHGMMCHEVFRLFVVGEVRLLHGKSIYLWFFCFVFKHWTKESIKNFSGGDLQAGILQIMKWRLYNENVRALESGISRRIEINT